MPITINGGGTITGITPGGLPDGTVQPSDLSTGAPTWDTSGNVGVGTGSPNERLTITAPTSGSYIQICDSSTDGTSCGRGGTGLLYRYLPWRI